LDHIKWERCGFLTGTEDCKRDYAVGIGHLGKAAREGDIE
jgi:hypothetical protein